jgi:hypothetical protein
VEKIPTSATEFTKILKKLSNYYHKHSSVLISTDGDLVPSDEVKSLYENLDRFSRLPHDDPRYKIWDRFIRLHFCKGGKFGRSEQIVAALQLNHLNASDLHIGLRQTGLLETFIVYALHNTMTFTKQYKAWTTNMEHYLFEFIGSSPHEEEKVMPHFQELFTRMVSQDWCRFVLEGPTLDEKKFDLTSKWLANFIPSRNLPSPTDDGAVDEYEKYLGFLTTRDHIGTIVQPQEVENWVSSPIGRDIENFLSGCMTSEILEKITKGKKQSLTDLLEGKSQPNIPVSTSSNYQSPQAKFGHYGTIAKEVIPFLRRKVSETFPYAGEDSTGKYIVDDHGNPICKWEFRDYPIWQVAYMESVELEEKDFLKGVKGIVLGRGDRLGLDSRFGSMIFLYSIFHVRPWLDAHDRILEEFPELNYTEDQLRDFISSSGIIIPKERTVPIFEPGGKTRWVSAAEAAMIFYISPLGEDLRELFQNLESARIGLTQDNPLFRFEQSFSDHTMNKMLAPRALPFLPEDALVIIDEYETYGKSKVFARLTVPVAKSLSKSYRIPLLSALASLTPRGDEEFHAELVVALNEDDYCRHILRQEGLHDMKDYREIDKYILEDPKLSSFILVITTTDMVKATDTFRHDLSRLNLTAIAERLALIDR